MLTLIGMEPAAHATRRMLEHDVDWIMVVGVAGGVDHTIVIGSVVVPELVVDRVSGDRFRPTHAGDLEPRGILSCGDELITDPAAIAALEDQGVVAVDMETAAVRRSVRTERDTVVGVPRGSATSPTAASSTTHCSP